MRPIIFFGTEDFSAVSLQKMLDAGFNVAGIITKPDAPKGRGRQLHAPIVKEIGEKHNIPVLQPAKMSEVAPFIGQFDKPIGVLVSFGRIIPQSIIELFTPAIVNVHPSLLPLYRGASPIESAILNGDAKTGVSLMELAPEMDAGDVYLQREIKLNGTETASELYRTAGEIGAQMLVEFLPKLMENPDLPSQKQDDELATYCGLLKKPDALLDESQKTAAEAERQVRAFEIFPKTKIKIGENLVIINEAEVVKANPEGSQMVVKFRDGEFLKIKKLAAPSGKQMSAESFENGYLK